MSLQPQVKERVGSPPVDTWYTDSSCQGNSPIGHSFAAWLDFDVLWFKEETKWSVDRIESSIDFVVAWTHAHQFSLWHLGSVKQVDAMDTTMAQRRLGSMKWHPVGSRTMEKYLGVWIKSDAAIHVSVHCLSMLVGNHEAESLALVWALLLEETLTKNESTINQDTEVSGK